MFRTVLLALAILPYAPHASAQLHLNEIQALGSHNSYRKATDPRIYRFVRGLSGFLPEEYNPDGWDYSHAPLSEQLEQHGIRSFELDIYNDPLGGQFDQPGGHVFIGRRLRLKDPAWQEPGMKLMHIADFDYNSHHVTLKGALAEIREWSAAHPLHVPICIMIEPKTFGVSSFAPIWPFTALSPFDALSLDALDDELLAVFGAGMEGVFRPDDLRAQHPDLQTAVHEDAWPLLDALRGKVYFVAMLSEEEQRAYKSGHPGLASRAMFYFGDPTQDRDAVFVKVDDPAGHEAEIQALVRAGYMVRTRADADTREARSGDTTRLQAALRSGAQVISTDYYLPAPKAGQAGWSRYRAALPEGAVAVPNPVLVPGFLGRVGEGNDER